MKVTYEFNTADDSFDVCEYEQIKHASDMVAALWDLSCQIRGWQKNNNIVTGETVADVFYDTLAQYHIDLDVLNPC